MSLAVLGVGSLELVGGSAAELAARTFDEGDGSGRDDPAQPLDDGDGEHGEETEEKESADPFACTTPPRWTLARTSWTADPRVRYAPRDAVDGVFRPPRLA